MQRKYGGGLPIIVTNYAGTPGVPVRQEGTQAYTDGREIIIPSLDLTDLKKVRCAYGYLAHEAAHIRYTDFQVVSRYQDQVLKHALLNILEDARVERLIGADYIGVWENLQMLHSGSESDWERYVKEIDGKPPLQILLGFLLCYTGAYSQRFRILRSRAAFLFWKSRRALRHRELGAVARLSLKILKARNTADVAAITDAIFAVLNTRGCFDKKASSASLKAMPLKLKRGRNGHIRGSFRPGNELKEQCESLSRSIGESLAGIAPGADPSAMGDEDGEFFSRAEPQKYRMGECRRGRANFLSKIAPTANLRRTLTSKVLAWCERYGAESDRGRRLNARRAALIPMGESRIFYDRRLEEDHSTSVHLLVDVSGSMLSTDGSEQTRCDAACRCALSLCVALENIDGIVTMCSFFPGFKHEVETALTSHQKASMRAPFFDQSPRGSTPLAQAVRYATDASLGTPCQRHLLVVLTDGIPDSLMQARDAVKRAEDCHIECYGIGIRLDFIKTLLPKSEVIQTPDELDEAVFSLLGRIITSPEV